MKDKFIFEGKEILVDTLNICCPKCKGTVMFYVVGHELKEAECDDCDYVLREKDLI